MNSYGVGTSLVTGSGAPTAGFVYKLVERDGVPVEKRSANKRSHGGRKTVFRRLDGSGRAVADVVVPRPQGPLHTDAPDGARPLLQPLVVDGLRQDDGGLEAARHRVQDSRGELPPQALQLSRGNAAITAEFVSPLTRRHRQPRIVRGSRRRSDGSLLRAAAGEPVSRRRPCPGPS